MRTKTKPKLQVWSITLAAYQFVYANRRLLWRWAILSMCVYFAASVIISLLETWYPDSFILEIFYALVELLIIVPFLVICFRLVLLGPTSVASKPRIKFGTRERVYAIKTVVIYSITIVFISPIYISVYISVYISNHLTSDYLYVFIVMSIIVSIFIFAVMFQLFRLSFVFPAVCIDRDGSLKKAWRLGKGNSLRLAAIIILPSMPVLIPLAFLDYAIESGLSAALGSELSIYMVAVASAATETLGAFFSGAILAAVLSNSYRFLISARKRTKKKPLPEPAAP